MEVTINKKLTKVKIMLTGAELMYIRDAIKHTITVRVPIHSNSALMLVTLAELFRRRLNVLAVQPKETLILTISEAVAINQFFAKDKEFWQLAYNINVCLTKRIDNLLPS